MRVLTLLLSVLLLAGCGSQSGQVFGASYDECVLRNARTGGDRDSRELAEEICQRRFERAPTRREKEQLFPGLTVRFDDSYLGDNILVSVDNRTRNLVVTELEASVVFMDRDRQGDGLWPADAQIVDTLVWSLNPAAQPLELGSAVGTFDDGRAPSRFTVKKIIVTRVLPLDGR